jgi:hypothetical protein
MSGPARLMAWSLALAFAVSCGCMAAAMVAGLRAHLRGLRAASAAAARAEIGRKGAAARWAGKRGAKP